jgi:hypothetical protein
MTNHQPIPAAAALVAIDIAKTRNEVLLEVPGQRRRQLIVLNTRREHDHLIEILKSLELPVVAGLEATGNYRRPLTWSLLEAGVELRLISSVALGTRQALRNGWDKNDPKNAQVILHMLMLGICQRYHDPFAHGLNDIQELSKMGLGRSTRLPSSPRRATCAGSTITASFSSSVASIWRSTSPGRTVAGAGPRSSATPGSGAPSGWPPRSPSASGTAPFGASSSAITRGTGQRRPQVRRSRRSPPWCTP